MHIFRTFVERLYEIYQGVLGALAGLDRLSIEDHALAVVHGGTVLTIMQALFPEEEKSGYDWQPSPGGGYRIDLTAHCYEQIGLL